MPLIHGIAMSYSPLLYRPRSQWQEIAEFLRGAELQPESASLETATVLDHYAERVSELLSAIEDSIERARLDALLVLTADRGSLFDESNVPQFHVQVGGEIWGRISIPELGEPEEVRQFACDEKIAELLTEQLVRDGYDLAESRAAFRPVGDPGQGAGRQESEALARFAGRLPVVPVHINCHMRPLVSGNRIHAFGRSLGRACDLSERRIGILASGGLSGNPGGDMAGWIDDVLDRWILSRLTLGKVEDVAGIWRTRSRTLLGNAADIRLWVAAAGALEATTCAARVLDYIPLHHAATGIAAISWEQC